MSTVFTQYIAVILASTIKFLGGTFTGFALGLHWVETAILSTIGMMVTVITVNYVGSAIRNLIGKYRKKEPKRFTKMNRMAVKVWNKFGVIGIAFLTPCLFTPPVGAFLLVALRAPRGKAFFWMLVSGLVWGVIFTLLVYELRIVQEWFTHRS